MYYHFAILLIEISTLLQFLISFTDGKIFIKKSSLYILKHSPRRNNNNFYALKPQVANNAHIGNFVQRKVIFAIVLEK